ncbi:MAG: exodeoxyribonuclease VII large subunit [Balneolaceae bacterium]
MTRSQTPHSFDIPSVSELTSQIKSLIESNFMDVLVEGELSNVNQSRNGHYYFTVKDDEAQLPCVMWKNTARRLGSEIADGQQVVLGGNLQVYPPHGRYQLIVNLVEQAGRGKLQEAFEKLKEKLLEEGLFDESHKKRLPAFPKKIGVITSATGAAFQDIRSTIERRWPLCRILLYHASVQGEHAAPELIKGIETFTGRKVVDVLIIGRGGGSLEDLWPFNEEAVARALFHCPIPVISAVGHEVDFSISDFVADARAATPTQAAVMATPDINEIRLLVDDLGKKLTRSVRDKTDRYRDKVNRLSGSHALLVVADRMKSYREQIRMLREQIKNRLDRQVNRNKEKLTALSHRLEKTDPNAPLEKGYVRVWQGEKWIRQRSTFAQNKEFELEWKDGKLGNEELKARN